MPAQFDNPADLHTFLYSTGVTLIAFHFFLKVPSNLQKYIFTLASPPPRTHFLEIYAYNSALSSARIRYIPRLPALFHACSTSRLAIINMQGGELINFLTPPKYTKFYFNFKHDVLFLSSRFSSTLWSTETFRLRELNALVPYFYLQRLKRVVVTYAGLDDYSQIANTMRWLSGMEVLYVAMMDWWSKRSVKRMLRKGVPRRGDVSGRIEKVVREAEAEETDDEDEEETDRKERLRVRGLRRILEVELRLEE